MSSEPDKSLNMNSDAKPKKRKANKGQNKKVDMREDSNLGENAEQKEGDTETKLYKQPKRTKKGVCVKCNRTMIMFPNSLCFTCYNKHLKAKREKEGQKEPKHLVICLKCNLLKKHKARQLCQSCYDSVHRSKKLNQYVTTRVKSHYDQKGICVKCNESKPLYERFMCSACYEKDKKAKRKAGGQKCGNCGKLELLELNGFCSNCNSDERVKEIADGSNLIDQKLKVILKSIEENELILFAQLTVHSSLAAYAKYFEQFSKINIEFLDFRDLDESNDANLDEESSDPSKYSIGNEDFIDRLKQYTRSKLKPLKKQNGPINTKNASSIFNVANSAKSKIKSPSKPKAKKKVKLKECIDCKQMKLHKARGRCGACYQRFMKQKKKEDAKKAKAAEQVEENSGQNVLIQENNVDQVEAPPVKPKKKQSSDA